MKAFKNYSTRMKESKKYYTRMEESSLLSRNYSTRMKEANIRKEIHIPALLSTLLAAGSKMLDEMFTLKLVADWFDGKSPAEEDDLDRPRLSVSLPSALFKNECRNSFLLTAVMTRSM